LSILYQIRHVTRHRYETPVSESVMEVRKCPLSSGLQRCLNFSLSVAPHATIYSYEEPIGNTVHHFDVPQPHRQMSVTAEALVEVKEFPVLPASLSMESWSQVKAETAGFEFLDYLLPSPLIRPTRLLGEYYEKVGPGPDEDPLTFLRRLQNEIASAFAYVPLSTQVDSSVDIALETREGVCQDFAHIMVGLARLAEIPARYVSGYLHHRSDGSDRSTRDASHAWCEAYLPRLGWLGFDPTNNIPAEERHIRTCLGRDYRDVPPTRGVYRGQPASELSVAVQVHPADMPNVQDEFRRMDESDLSPQDSWVIEAEQQAQQ
jgi:transglutaminase-like putative cysteine protease